MLNLHSATSNNLNCDVVDNPTKFVVTPITSTVREQPIPVVVVLPSPSLKTPSIPKSVPLGSGAKNSVSLE